MLDTTSPYPRSFEPADEGRESLPYLEVEIQTEPGDTLAAHGDEGTTAKRSLRVVKTVARKLGVGTGTENALPAAPPAASKAVDRAPPIEAVASGEARATDADERPTTAVERQEPSEFGELPTAAIAKQQASDVDELATTAIEKQPPSDDSNADERATGAMPVRRAAEAAEAAKTAEAAKAASGAKAAEAAKAAKGANVARAAAAAEAARAARAARTAVAAKAAKAANAAKAQGATEADELELSTARVVKMLEELVAPVTTTRAITEPAGPVSAARAAAARAAAAGAEVAVTGAPLEPGPRPSSMSWLGVVLAPPEVGAQLVIGTWLRPEFCVTSQITHVFPREQGLLVETITKSRYFVSVEGDTYRVRDSG